MSLDRDIEYYQKKQKRLQYQAGLGAVVAAAVLILVFTQDSMNDYFVSAGLLVSATAIVYVWYTLTMWAKTYRKLLELRGKVKR